MNVWNIERTSVTFKDVRSNSKENEYTNKQPQKFKSAADIADASREIVVELQVFYIENQHRFGEPTQSADISRYP